MASMTWLSVVVVVLFALMESQSHSAHALTCYNCTSVKENHLCDQHYQKEIQCGMGFPFCIHIHMSIPNHGEYDVLRCATAKECEQQSTTSAVTKTCCNTELCNKLIT